MSTDSHDDPLRLALAEKRDIIVNRLTRVLGAIDRRRRAVTHVAEDVAALVPRASAKPGASGGISIRNALVGAAAGGLVAAFALLVERRRRERRRPREVLQRAWFKYAMPPKPSLLSRLVREVVGSLVRSVASAAAGAIVARALEAAQEQRGPEVHNPSPDVPEADLVRSPVLVDSTAPSSDTAKVQPGVAPLAPLRDFL